jgi:hypothetical protein
MAIVTLKFEDDSSGVSVRIDCNESPDKGLTPAMIMGSSLAEYIATLQRQANAVQPLSSQDRCH